MATRRTPSKKKQRKRDIRTIERIKLERTARAKRAGRHASESQAQKRLQYLDSLCRMRAAGLSLQAMARDFERREIKTMRGSRSWEVTTIRNLLEHFEPFFRWRDSASLRSKEDRDTYFREVQPVLGGKVLGDYYAAAQRFGTSLIRHLPPVPPLSGYQKPPIGLVEFALMKDWRGMKPMPPDGPPRSAEEIAAYDAEYERERSR